MKDRIYFYDDITHILNKYAEQEGVEEMVNRVLQFASIALNNELERRKGYGRCGDKESS